MSTSTSPGLKAAAPCDLGGGPLRRRGRARRRHRARPPAPRGRPPLLPRRCSTSPPAPATSRCAPRAISPDVTGLDLVPSLLDIARSRAATSTCTGSRATPKRSPSATRRFDRVLSVFGVHVRPAPRGRRRRARCACAGPAARSGSSTGRPRASSAGSSRSSAPTRPRRPRAPRRRRCGATRSTCARCSPATTSTFERGVNPFVLPERRGVHDVLRGALRADAEGEGAAARPTAAGSSAAPRCARSTTT